MAIFARYESNMPLLFIKGKCYLVAIILRQKKLFVISWRLYGKLA